MQTLSRTSLLILHAENNPEYAGISELFLKRAGFVRPIIHCRDGAEALRYFSSLESKPIPDVILLDLHMPHLNGLEVLHWLRRRSALRDIPIFLLTSSNEPADRRRAAAEGATGYLLKSPFFEDVIRALDRQIEIISQQNSHPRAADSNAESEPLALLGEDLYFERQNSFLL